MKNWKSRTLALVLVLIMAVSILPMAAMAASTSYEMWVYENYYASAKDKLNNPIYSGDQGTVTIDSKTTITTKDFKNLIETADGLFELEGLHLWPLYDSKGNFIEDFPNVTAGNSTTSITIPAFPEDEAKQQEWLTKYGDIILAYAPHQHDNAYWTYSKTNHWFNCAECGKNQLMMDWHSDFNADDICDVCGGPIVYYPVEIADTENGTVSIEKDEYRLNDIVYIELDPADGYVLDQIMAFKHREDGTSARLVVRAKTKGSEYYFKMPSFDCEVVVTFKKA